MFNYQEKITEQTKSQKTQFEEIEKASESHLVDMSGLSYQEYKMTIINMLRVLMDKIDCIQEHMGILFSKTNK